MPKFIANAALRIVRGTVKDKANFDILDLNPLQNHVKKAFVPAFFIAAN